MIIVAKIAAFIGILLGVSFAQNASAANYTTLDYGTVQSVSTVKKEGTAAACGD